MPGRLGYPDVPDRRAAQQDAGWNAIDGQNGQFAGLPAVLGWDFPQFRAIRDLLEIDTRLFLQQISVIMEIAKLAREVR